MEPEYCTNKESFVNQIGCIFRNVTHFLSGRGYVYTSPYKKELFISRKYTDIDIRGWNLSGKLFLIEKTPKENLLNEENNDDMDCFILKYKINNHCLKNVYFEVRGNLEKKSDCLIKGAYNSDFSYTDLSSSDLSDTNLSVTNLHHANFSNSILNNTIMKYSMITRSYFAHSNMNNVDYHGSDLECVQFYELQIKNTSFRCTNLENAIFDNVKLDNVCFNYAYMNSVVFKDTMKCYTERAVDKHPKIW